jgi:hypothetical protein
MKDSVRPDLRLCQRLFAQRPGNDPIQLLKRIANRTQSLTSFVKNPKPRLPAHHLLPANQTSRIEPRTPQNWEVFEASNHTVEHTQHPRRVIESMRNRYPVWIEIQVLFMTQIPG